MKISYKIIIFLSLFIWANSTFANAYTDSLETVILKLRGKEKITAKLDLSYYLRRDDADKAKLLAENSLDEIRVNNYGPDLEARGLYCLGLSYFNMPDYQNALDLFYRAVTLTQENHNDKLLSDLYYHIGASHYYYYGDNTQTINYYNQCIHYALISDNYRILGAVYSSLSNLLRINGSYEKSLEFINKSRTYYEKAHFLEGLAWIDYITGNLYSTIGIYQEAEKAFTSSLNLYRKLSKTDNVTTGVAICLDQLAVVNNELNNEELARKYNAEAKQLYIKEGSRYGISNSLKYLAEIELKAENYDRSFALLDSSLAIKKEINDIIGFSSIYNLYGILLIDKGEYQSALDSLKIGLSYALKNNQMKNLNEINRQMATAYEKLGQYYMAYKYKSVEVSVSDSILNAKVGRNMVQLETLYEIENKDKEIKELQHEKLISDLSMAKQKNLQQYLLFIIILASIIILMFIYLYLTKVRSNKDLLESKRMVEEINMTKDRFFSILAHDLRNPFNSILGLVNILKNKYTEMDPQQREKIINAIYESANNSYELLINLLDWSRTQRGTITFNPESFLINDVAEKVKELLNGHAGEKGISINIASNPVEVYADKNMINTVLRNLISNSIKYSNNHDSISVNFEKTEKDVHVSVSDTGIGIADDNSARLFNITDKYQIEGTAGEKGTGLGLIICKEFIDEHDGKIWVESELGHGSTFHFTLPLNEIHIKK